MQITDVRVRRIEREGRMKAIVSITLDNEFVVHDIKVIDGEKGLFIAMPSRRSTDGEYRDIAHPINSETRDMIQSIVLEKYQATASGWRDDAANTMSSGSSSTLIHRGSEILLSRKYTISREVSLSLSNSTLGESITTLTFTLGKRR